MLFSYKVSTLLPIGALKSPSISSFPRLLYLLISFSYVYALISSYFIVSTNVKQYEFRIYETRLSMQKKLKESNDRKENLLNLISTQ